MEVHAHTHTPRKKWTHYFWEFLMLFLAVFCGFMAENFREHQIENQRERQFMKTLVKDIELDIEALNTCINFRMKQEGRIDTLIDLLEGSKDSLNEIYYLGRWLTRTNDLFYNDRTIQQLKNAGGLRLVRSESVSEQIVLYDARIRQIIQYRQPLENESRNEMRRIFAKVFNGFEFNRMLADDPSVFAIKPSGNPALFSTSPGLINELVMNAQYLKSIYKVTRSMDTDVADLGQQLIQLIKKSYKLK